MGVTWLVRGIKMEAMMIDTVEDGSCYRNLAALCYSVADTILNALNRGENLDGKVVLTATEVVKQIERKDLSNNEEIKISELGPVVVLMQVHNMFEALGSGDRTLLPKFIMTCFTKDPKTSAPYAPFPMQAALLQLACNLLVEDFRDAQDSGGLLTTSVFDKSGISTLMRSLLLLESLGECKIDVVHTKEILLRGLSQAIVAENATKPLIRNARGGRRSVGNIDISSVRTASLSTQAVNVQEAVVQRMLDF